LGEGGFYVSLAEYKEWFRRYLGFDPYPGTLNLRLEPESIAKRKLLEGYDGFRIPPMSRGERSYCGARLFRAVINDAVEAGVVARA
jgi:riboflavin kinase